MSTTIDLLSPNAQYESPRSLNLFKSLAEKMDITLEQFFFEMQQHMVQYPLQSLAEFLVALSDTLESPDNGASQHFDTRIRAAAIMLNTLEGRALALAEENADVRRQFDALSSDIAPRLAELESMKPVQPKIDGMNFILTPGHRGAYNLILYPEGTEPNDPNDPSCWNEHTQVHMLWDDKFINRADPLSPKGHWTIYAGKGLNKEIVNVIEVTSVDARIFELENTISELRLTGRNQQIALDAKDERIAEMAEHESNYESVQRDRVKLQEDLDSVKAYASKLAEELTEARNAPAYLESVKAVDNAHHYRSRIHIDARKRSGSAVNHPGHYNAHPSGIECIDVVEHMSFNLGNAMKYLWRGDHKGQRRQDLKKAIWYIKRELKLTKKG